jgi:hypothetical protein
MFAILVGYMTLRDWGIGWMLSRWLWLTNIIISLLTGIVIRHSDAMEAGADWFKYGKSWVRIYELTVVKLDKAWGSDRLELKDSGDREVWIKIADIQNNPDLWNLVYNGILHSVHRGGAVVNERAVVCLLLDEPRSASAADDQRG